MPKAALPLLLQTHLAKTSKAMEEAIVIQVISDRLSNSVAPLIFFQFSIFTSKLSSMKMMKKEPKLRY
jgi:hypothetical protein